MPGFNIPNAAGVGCGTAASATGPSNAIETARNHRYLLEVLEPLGTKDNGIILFLEKCSRPSPEFDKIVIHSAQDEISRPGKTHWKDVEFTFYERLTGDSKNENLEDTCAKLIYNWWSSTMLDVSKSLFAAPSAYLKNCTLQMLDGGGGPVWNYHMYDCWPVKVSPSDLAYSDTDIARIGVTLAYSRAVEQGRS